MRRKDKKIKETVDIEQILLSNQVCTVSFAVNNGPYMVSMNYGYEDRVLYFHCAREGKKIEMIRTNPLCCFSIVENVQVLSADRACSFGTKYRSVIGTGRMKIIDTAGEKEKGLKIIMKQHTGHENWTFLEEQTANIFVLKLEIEAMTGKKSG